MSKKTLNSCAMYNIPLINDDDNYVFRTGCVHLYNFLHGKSAEYKPLMLKMNLEFVDSPLMAEAEGKNIEQQQEVEEETKSLRDVLKQSQNDGNQLMDRIDNVEKNKNSFDYERNNALQENQSAQQLGVKIKTLEDALLVKDDVVNQLMERMKKLEMNLSNSLANNSTTQDNSIEKLKHPDNNSHHTNQQSFYGCTIFNMQKYTGCDEFGSVIKLAKRIGLSFNRDQIYNINVYYVRSNSYNYCVYFYNKDLRDEFLRKSHILKELSEISVSIETECYHTVVIRNVAASNSSHNNSPSDLSSAISHVIQMAKQMYLWLTRDHITHIDVFKGSDSGINKINNDVYCVYFYTKRMKDTFLEKSHIFKDIESTKHLQFY